MRAVEALVVAAALTMTRALALLECTPGISTPGATFPRGDIVIEYGNPLQVDCVLNPGPGRSSRNLGFTMSGDPVDRRHLTVLNETALRLRIERPPMSNSVIACVLLPEGGGDPEAVCMNVLIVGEKPTPVRDFDCVSENRDRLVCSWTPPFNYLKVNYSLGFALKGRSSRNRSFMCPLVDRKNSTMECVWSMETSPQYKQVHEYYNFSLRGSNAFGDLEQHIVFNHFAHIRLAPVENVTVRSATPHGVSLSFLIPAHLPSLPKQIEYRLMYTTEHSNGAWKRADFRSVSKRQREVNATVAGLEYAYALYDFRISIRVEGVRLEKLWSDNATVTFRTAEERPRRPPHLVVGCFESKSIDADRRDVYVYWSRLEKSEEAGENFTYKVVRASSNGVDVPLAPDLVNKNYMRFSGFPSAAVELAVVSTNRIGDSENASTTLVPARDSILAEPKDFTKKPFGEGQYELLWTRNDETDVTNYTVFWCDNVKDRPYQCQGRLSWMTVPAGRDSVNVSIGDPDKIYQFAISANGVRSSSGMVWAVCTIISDRPAEKMRNVWIDKAGDVFIELGWRLECSDKGGQVLGYNVSYCPIYDPEKKLNCGAPSMSVFIPGGTETIRGNITGLRPYTTYRLSVAVVTEGGAGNPSDYLYNTTSEGAPSALRHVRVTDLRNNSALVSWETPHTINGHLKNYRVIYAWNGLNVTKEVEKENSLLLSNLDGYTNYTVVVLACTTVCSSTSNRVAFRTAIGKPGLIDRPHMETLSERMVKISWEPPVEPGGTLDEYEVKIVTKMNDDTNRTLYNSTTMLSYEVPFKVCETPDIYAYYFYIRAVNFDKAEDHGAADYTNTVSLPNNSSVPRKKSITYKGDWSQEIFNLCTPNHGNGSWWIIGIVAFFVLLLFIYCLKVSYQRFKIMKNIKPCLPPGLDLQYDNDPKQHKWSNPTKHIKDSDKSSLTPFGDSESLLIKPAALDLIDRSGICERSNCSANTDSTAVSLTSNRVSSDEAKESSENQDGVQSDTLSNHSSIRNIGYNGSRRGSAASTEPLNLNSPKIDYGDMAPPYCAFGTDRPETNINTRVATVPGYVALGAIMNDLREKDSSLPNVVPIAPIDELAPNYVMNGIIHSPMIQPKKTSPGYVSVDDVAPVRNQNPAFDNIELISVPLKFSNPNKNTDYVKRNDSILANGLQKNNHPTVNLPLDNLGQSQAALSPEAYCRFGPNTNVPHHFEFKQSDNIDGDYAASLKDDPDTYFGKPDELPISPASQPHYVPLKH